jgi:hypothetical protein
MREGIEFRFTLSNPTEGEVLIDEPVGWNKSTFTLKRDPKYHSLLFEYSTSLKFYFANGIHNGGAEFIKFIEGKYGPDGEVGVLVEVSYHNSDWEVFFEGRLDLEAYVESEVFIECSIEQTDFFTIFNQRSDLKVSFADNISVDGVALQEYTPYEIAMHSKVLVKRTEIIPKEAIAIPAAQTHEFTIQGAAPGFPNPNQTGVGDQPLTEYNVRTSYIQFELSGAEVEELDDYWNVAGGGTSTEPPEIYTASEAGLHTFDININADIIMEAISTGTATAHRGDCDRGFGGLIEDYEIIYKFIIRDESDVVKYSNSFLSLSGHIGCIMPGPDNNLRANGVTEEGVIGNLFLEDYNLSVGDKVFLYAEITMSGEYERLINFINSKVAYGVGHTLLTGSYVKIKGETFTEDSTAVGFRVHDVLQNTINKITNRDDTFYSETFGYPEAPYHSYAEKGCYADFAIMNGFNIRGFPWEQRPLQLSFIDLYDSLDAIFSLSLSLELIEDLWKIRIEKKNYSYTKDVFLTLEGVNKIKRSIAKDKFYSQINVGYEKSLPEEINGLDEFATVHNYATANKTIGKPYVAISKVIASGSIIEVTRRLQYNETVTTDSKYDNDLFIIALNHDDPTLTETNENFPVVNNLLSPETAYNLDLSPARNLLRHGNVINGGLLKKNFSEYKFMSGEGNYLMESQTTNECPGSFDGELLAENQDIPWNYADVEEVDPCWVPYELSFTFPLSMEDVVLIKLYKNRAINISGDIHEDGDLETVFILDLDYEPVTGLAEFKCLAASTLPYNYVPEDADNLLLNDGFDLLFEDGSLILLN